MATATERLFGKSIKRREDPRFITGRGQYVDDLKLPGMTYAAFVRSPHAHARIKKVDAAAARKVAGVLAVYAGEDVQVGGLPCGRMLPRIQVPGGADGKKAHAPGAPQLFDEIPKNQCFYWTIGDKASTDAAFASAATVVTQPLVNQR